MIMYQLSLILPRYLGIFTKTCNPEYQLNELNYVRHGDTRENEKTQTFSNMKINRSGITA